jgi:hypothetical protein
MTYDFETALYWRRVAARLRAEAIQCAGAEILSKLQAAHLAEAHAADFEAHLARSTACVDAKVTP